MENEQNISGVSPNISETIDKSIQEKKQNTSEIPLLLSKKIGISISDSPDLMQLGYSSMHLQDASVEFARYFLVHGAMLIYGGDLRKDGYTNIFSELTRLYSTKETFDQFRFKNFFAWPIHLQLTKSNELDFRQNKVKIEKLPLPTGVNVDDVSKAIAPITNENKVVWAKSLSYMRGVMNADCDARIFLGGQLQNFKGKYLGLIEEAYLALQDDNKPVYFIGVYGGATKEIIELLLGQTSDKINKDYQIADPAYKEFYEFWNQTAMEKIDYGSLSSFFSNYGLSRLSTNNGLSEEENKRLFETNNLSEMIYYVLKGLIIKYRMKVED